MTIFQALVLGVVQGLSEFLPISSSGHLVLLSKLPFWTAQPLVFDTTLHLATALTLVVYFRTDLFNIAVSFLKDLSVNKLSVKKYSSQSNLLFYMLAGSIPAGVLGFVFESDFEERFRSLHSVAFFMFLGTVLMWVAQKYGKSKRTIDNAGFVDSIKIGLFQALALFPGVSRSGATISGALLNGLDKVSAARFSFLLSIPIVVLAGGYKLVSTDWTSIHLGITPLIVGFLSSFLVGLLVVHFLLNYLKSKSLDVFLWYRLLVVLAVLLVR